LRGEGAGDTLQPLTDVVTATNYVDRQVQPGVTYRYAVRAVDNAPKRNESPESNRQQAAIR
jgi:fibronectin type 3 domain-containing protein